MRWLDRAYARLSVRPRCFEGGWGDHEVIASGLDRRWRDDAPAPARLRWTRSEVLGDLRVDDGEMLSPEPELPPESRVARVRWLRPRFGAPRALAVALAAWGDEGFADRERFYGAAVRSGVSVLLLEQALYGRRRRVGQRDVRLRYVSDFVLMGRAAVQEARALLSWGREAGFEDVGVVGFSMGAQMASFTGALIPWPIRVVPIAVACSPAAVFFDGPLARDLSFDGLGAGARERVREVMEGLSILELPPPHDPSLVRLVGTRRDGICPPGDVDAIARHWGAHPRWIDDGHVSVVVRRAHAMSQALVDAFS